jgi:hypothetical protein
VGAVKNMAILVPQEQGSLGVVWVIAVEDLMTRLLCSVPQVAMTLQTLPAITGIPTYSTKTYNINKIKFIYIIFIGIPDFIQKGRFMVSVSPFYSHLDKMTNIQET